MVCDFYLLFGNLTLTLSCFVFVKLLTMFSIIKDIYFLYKNISSLRLSDCLILVQTVPFLYFFIHFFLLTALRKFLNLLFEKIEMGVSCDYYSIHSSSCGELQI